MKVSVIYAETKNGGFGLGKEGLPWTKHNRVDMERFISVTLKADIVLMGANTFTSLPRPLRDRYNMVVANSSSDILAAKDGSQPDEVLSLEDNSAINIYGYLKEMGYSEVVVIGGKKLLQDFLDYNCVDVIYRTVFSEDGVWDIPAPCVDWSSFKRTFERHYFDLTIETYEVNYIEHIG